MSCKPTHLHRIHQMENKRDEMPTSMTLLDFMGWNLDQGESDANKDVDAKVLSKPANIVTNKKFSYIERLENLGCTRSPTARD